MNEPGPDLHAIGRAVVLPGRGGMSAAPAAAGQAVTQVDAELALRVEAAVDEAALELLRADWERLWSEDIHADVFGSFDWFVNWWKHFGRRDSTAALVTRVQGELTGLSGIVYAPYVCVARTADGRAAAILPLVRAQVVFRGRRVRVLSVPVNSHAPRTCIAIGRDAGSTAPVALARHIAGLRDYDLVLFDGLNDAGGHVARLMGALTSCGLFAGPAGRWSHSYLRFDGAWDEFLLAQGRHFRKSLRQAERGLEKLGAVTVERYGAAEACRRGLPLFLGIDAASWKARDGESVAGHAALRSYYSELCSRLAVHDRCELWVLRVAVAAVACFFCLTAKGTCYTLKASFVDAIGSGGCSPGRVLLTDMARQLWSTDSAGMDFVSNVPFMERWANAGTTCVHAVFYRSRSAALGAKLADRGDAILRGARVFASRMRLPMQWWPGRRSGAGARGARP